MVATNLVPADLLMLPYWDMDTVAFLIEMFKQSRVHFAVLTCPPALANRLPTYLKLMISTAVITLSSA